MLPLSDTSKTSLWKTNVQGTCNIAQAVADHAVKKLVFTSTSCLWGQPMGRPVTEADTPHPVDIYGESKWEAGMSVFCKPFTAAKIQYFDHANLADAMAWMESE